VLIAMAFPQEVAVMDAGHSPSKVVVELMLILPLVVKEVVPGVVADVVAGVVVDIDSLAGMSSPKQLLFSRGAEQQSPSGSALQNGNVVSSSSPKHVSCSSFSSSSVHLNNGLS